MDYVHVFVLRTLCVGEDGEIKSRNVAVTFDMFEACLLYTSDAADE